MVQIRRLLSLAALVPILSYALPSSADTTIDEWPNVKAPPPPELKSVTLNPKIGDTLPPVAPKGDEPVVTAFVDKFILGDKDTGLQKILKDKGITTVIPVGGASHNGILFTAVAASLRGFDVIVPVDGISGNNSYEDQLAAYTLTSSIVYKVTLTTTDMIKFQ